MGHIEHVGQHLEEARAYFVDGKTQAVEGKDHAEAADNPFNDLNNTKFDAVITAMGIVKKLLDVQRDLDNLAEIARTGSSSAESLASINLAIEPFYAARPLAGLGGLLVTRAIGTEEAPQYALDAAEKIFSAEQATRDMALETAAAQGTFSSLQEGIGDLRTSITQVSATLQNFTNDVGNIGNLPILKGPIENRNPRFIAHAADEAITAFETGIADVDQRLENI